MAENDLTLVGDTDHKQASIRAYVASAGFMRTARQAGVGFVGVEFCAFAQPVVDRFYEGRIDRKGLIAGLEKAYAAEGEQFASYVNPAIAYGTVATLVANARQENIRVFFLERDEGERSAVQKSYRTARDAAYRAVPGPPVDWQQFEGDYNAAHPLQYQAYKADVLAQRSNLAANKAILQTAFDSAAKYGVSGHMVIFYGAAHLPAMQQVAEARGLGVAAVDVFGSEGRPIPGNACLVQETGQDGSYPRIMLGQDRWAKALPPCSGQTRLATMWTP
jgi:hypothetical protein